MANYIKGSALRETQFGFASRGSKITVPQNATTTIFTVTGGRIVVSMLTGIVTTVIGGTTPALKLIATPSVGTANDMCTTLTVTTDEAGCMYMLPSAVGSALIGAVSTGKSGSVSGNTGAACGQVVNTGTIGMNVSAADATGAIQWTLLYVPLDDGAAVTAA